MGYCVSEVEHLGQILIPQLNTLIIVAISVTYVALCIKQQCVVIYLHKVFHVCKSAGERDRHSSLTVKCIQLKMYVYKLISCIVLAFTDKAQAILCMGLFMTMKLLVFFLNSIHNLALYKNCIIITQKDNYDIIFEVVR